MKKSCIVALVLIAFIVAQSKGQWEECNSGLQYATSQNFCSFAINGIYIFAGAAGYMSGVYLSTNNGDSWVKKSNGLIGDKATFINCLANNSDFIVAGTNAGVFISTDNGNSWTSKHKGITCDTILSLAIKGDNIFVGTYECGVFLSTNQGDTWVKKNTGLTDSSIYSLAIYGNNVIAGTTYGGVLLSTDNGDNWIEKNIGIKVYTLKINGNNIFAGTINGGVYLSTDNGDNWIQKNMGLKSNLGLTIIDLSISGNAVFAAIAWGGVFLSTNNGDYWVEKDDGLSYASVYSLSDNGSYIFAGTRSKGIFRAKLSDILAVEESKSTDDSQIYVSPNPATDYIEINVGANDRSPLQNIEIYNVFGNKVKPPPTPYPTPALPEGEGVRINVSGLAAGMYFIRVGVKIEKFIIIR